MNLAATIEWLTTKTTTTTTTVTNETAALLSASAVVSAWLLYSALVKRSSSSTSSTTKVSDTHQQSPPHPARVLPGTLPFLGNTLQVIKNAPRLHDWILDQFELGDGKPFQLQIVGGFTTTCLASPQLIEDVLKTQVDIFEKGPLLRDLYFDFLGNGIFISDNAKWVHQRKTGSRLFSTRTLRDAMTNTIQELLPILHRHFQESLESKKPLDLVNLFGRFTLEAFTAIGFGLRLGCLADLHANQPFLHAFDGAQQIISRRVLVPAPVWKLKRWLQIAEEKQLTQYVKLVDETVMGIISKSLQNRQQQGSKAATTSTASSVDLVTLFLDNVEADQANAGEEATFDRFDPVYLRDVIVSFLMAGRDTTADLLAWFFYRMSLHPEISQQIVNELYAKVPSAHLQPPNTIFTPTMEDVAELVYLEAVMKETLRLHPSIPGNTRYATKDTVLSDGTFIAKGSNVNFPSYALGRLETVWGKDAKEFKPERWLVDPSDPLASKMRNDISAFQFNAFGGGPRICLGMNLAMLETKIAIASLLHAFHVAIVPADKKVEYDYSITLMVKGELNAMPTRREQAGQV